MTQSAATVLAELQQLANPTKAEHSHRFFKTGPGQYGEADRFLGIRVPDQRKVARKHKGLPLNEVVKLLTSEFHEARLTSLFILVAQYGKGDEQTREAIFRLYLNNTKHVNNWDLVDSSAHQIVGAHLMPGDRRLLDNLAASDLLWERRIAMIATYHFIKKHDFADALRIAELLVHDEHDLIHKAVGWMLREIGKRDRVTEEIFLNKLYHNMPRTMLRYSIEHFEEPLRSRYLSGEI